jgi:hypothetical protein
MAVSARGQSYNAPHTVTRPVLEGTTVFVHAAPGALRVRGQAGSDSLRVEGTARAFSPEAADEATIEVRRENDRLHVTPSVPQPKVGTPRFDLTVRIPAGATIRIEGGPGPLLVQDVGTVVVQSWDGDARIRDVGGSVAVNRLTGALQLQRIGGPVRMLEGEGRLQAQGLRQGITIEQHGSGRISIGRSAGPVVVGNDGAGDVEVYDHDGSVHVKADGAGNIQVRNLTRSFRVDLDTAGRIRHTGVAGEVRLPR